MEKRKPLKLSEIRVIEGEIELLTGLHIGAGNTEMHIGGVDNLVVRHPFTNEPYIPGSSIKGKTRALLELLYGLPVYCDKVDENSGGITTPKILKINQIEIPDVEISDEDKKTIPLKAEIILKLFGGSGADIPKNIGPTRTAFFDCYFTESFRNELHSKNLPYTEYKVENRINRITGTAEHPRPMERVPKGARFEFKVTFKVLDREEDEILFKELIRGLKLLELDYLGGSGSRGYGRIKFHFKDAPYLSKVLEEFEKNPSSLFEV